MAVWSLFSCFCALRLLCNGKIARHEISDEFLLHLTTKSVCRISKQVKLGSTDLFYYWDSTRPIFKLTRPILWLWWSGIRVTVHRDVRRSSQTGESTGDRPAFSSFGLSSGYNFSKVTRSQIGFGLQFLKVNRIPDHQSYSIDRVNLNIDRVGFS